MNVFKQQTLVFLGHRNRLPRQCFVIYVLLLLVFITAGCKKFIEVPLPGTEIFPEDVYSSDQTATAAVTAIYGNMIHSNGFASGNTRSLTFLCALSADELENYSSVLVPREFYGNAINSNNAAIEGAFWDPAYQHIYEANAVLEGLGKSVGVSRTTREQLQGEALFIRAFCHFYLANSFGDVPYLDSTDYQINITKSRSARAIVYQRLITDLQMAQGRLDSNYVSIERVRPNKWAATALLARAYLYTGNWAAAEKEATTILNQKNIYALDSLDRVFLKNSKEAIWQLMPNNIDGFNTWEGQNFILNAAPATGESNSTILSNHLLDAFETGDKRRTIWVDSVTINGGNDFYYFPYKYKVQHGTELAEYSMVLRLAEIYLLRAEARAQQGNITGAKADLNAIRHRAGLPNAAANTNKELIDAIMHERQVELFTEWGHRWFDLKRSGKIDAILSTAKGAAWQDTDALYPIPQNERALNPNLTQNPGYN